MITAPFSRIAAATSAIFLVALTGWLFASGPRSPTDPDGGPSPVSAEAAAPRLTDGPAKPSQLAQDLIGTWVLAGTPDKIVEPPPKGGMLKFLTGRHWAITQADPKTGEVVYHHGGTYKLDGDEYSENVEYANASTAELVGKTHRFKMKVEGDTFTQIGIGNEWTQVWKRLK
jgi:hypothetical protein